jgi:hypothetical protein
MDCRVKPGNDEIENRSRGALTRPSLPHHHATKDSPLNKRGKRSAERRMPSMSALRKQVDAVCAAHLLRGCAPLISSLPPGGGGSGGGCARLSALTLAALATGYHPDGSAPEPGFPKTDLAECFARLAQLSSVKHAPCRPVFLPVDRGPRAARHQGSSG